MVKRAEKEKKEKTMLFIPLQYHHRRLHHHQILHTPNA